MSDHLAFCEVKQFCFYCDRIVNFIFTTSARNRTEQNHYTQVWQVCQLSVMDFNLCVYVSMCSFCFAFVCFQYCLCIFFFFSFYQKF